MTVLIVLGVIAAVLIAILTLKVGVRVSFGDSFRLWLIIGFIKKEVDLNSIGKTEEKPKEEPKETPEDEPKEETPKDELKNEPDAPKKSGAASFLDKFDKKKLIKFGFRALKGLLKLPRIDELEFNYISGGTEADKIAVSYGRMCAAVGATVPFINNFLRVKRWRITTNMDFLRTKPKYSGCIQITVTIGAVVAFGLWALVGLLKCRSNDKT